MTYDVAPSKFTNLLRKTSLPPLFDILREFLLDNHYELNIMHIKLTFVSPSIQIITNDLSFILDGINHVNWTIETESERLRVKLCFTIEWLSFFCNPDQHYSYAFVLYLMLTIVMKIPPYNFTLYIT